MATIDLERMLTPMTIIVIVVLHIVTGMGIIARIIQGIHILLIGILPHIMTMTITMDIIHITTITTGN
jgi:hypothetical protein